MVLVRAGCGSCARSRRLAVRLQATRPGTDIRVVDIDTDLDHAAALPVTLIGTPMWVAVGKLPLLLLPPLLLLNRRLRGVKFFRTLFFLPVVFPMALVAVIWRLILDRSPNGLLNASVHLVSGGLIPAHDWLVSSATARVVASSAIKG